jgi:SAM-dependent methyltransferase
MEQNINTRRYWENRFASGDWELKRGRWQTESFAKGQVRHLGIGKEFEGTLLDFGCGLGDAIPIYRKHFPKAKLIGVDISQSAIDICKEMYGTEARFLQGDHNSVPQVDIIIASNVFEHLTDDRNVARHLLSKCNSLYIVVPYREWPLSSGFEHVNSYDTNYFQELGKYTYDIFPCVGWSAYGFKALWYGTYFKNIFRLLSGRPLCRRQMQIIFKFIAQ